LNDIQDLKARTYSRGSSREKQVGTVTLRISFSGAQSQTLRDTQRILTRHLGTEPSLPLVLKYLLHRIDLACDSMEDLRVLLDLNDQPQPKNRRELKKILGGLNIG
jgi:hypothetical protein